MHSLEEVLFKWKDVRVSNVDAEILMQVKHELSKKSSRKNIQVFRTKVVTLNVNLVTPKPIF